MADEEDQTGLSPAVLQIIEKFADAMRADEGIDGDAIGRLERLLLSGEIPKTDEISTALFDLPRDGV